MSTLVSPTLQLSRLVRAESRSITPENPTGERGGGARALPEGENHPARELGLGWKCRPFITLPAGATVTLADIAGPGVLQHLWITPTGVWRHLILRMTWDDATQPSVECPIGDFFASGWAHRDNFAQVTSAPVCVNPGSAFNCYWEMPFRKRALITLENRATGEAKIYYQFDYELGEVPADAAYFHAQFRRQNPTDYQKEYVIVDGIEGRGHYVGTYLAWGVNNNGWWGEGEVKFFLDGDRDFPTICGTGTEDYFCGSYNFENRKNRQYQEYNTPYAGMPQVLRPDGVYFSQMRFSLYRWHLLDPVRFTQDLRVTVQALGWRSDHRFLPLRDDIASVAYWYQQQPAARWPALPDRNALEII
jgi:hypothetical protein